MRKQFIVSFLIFCTVYIYAQKINTPPKFGLGMAFDDAAYDAIPQNPAVHRFVEILPPSVSLKSYIPTIESQGESQSCVGWSLAYALTMMEAKVNGLHDATRIDEARLSPMFIYNHIKKPGDCRVVSSSLTDGLTFVKKTGTCEYNDYHPKDCNTMPSDDLLRSAMEHRISGYFKLFSRSEQTLNASYVTKNVKEALLQGKPVVVGMKVSLENFCGYHTSASNPYLDAYTSGKTYGHAMVVIGYDDEEEAFELLNSFGTDWGDAGFCKMKYSDFAEDVKYGFVMYTDKVLQITGDRLAANVGFASKRQGDLKWTSLYMRDSLGILYVNKALPVGDDVAFRVKPEQNCYLYILGTNTNGTLGITVPKKNPVAADSLLIFPEKKRMYIDRKGKHYLCILLSTRPISDLNQITGETIKSSASIRAVLEAYFPDRIVDKSHVDFTINGKKIHSSSQLFGDYNIVPIIMEINGI